MLTTTQTREEFRLTGGLFDWVTEGKTWLFYGNLSKVMELDNIPIAFTEMASMVRKERCKDEDRI